MEHCRCQYFAYIVRQNFIDHENELPREIGNFFKQRHLPSNCYTLHSLTLIDNLYCYNRKNLLNIYTIYVWYKWVKTLNIPNYQEWISNIPSLFFYIHIFISKVDIKLLLPINLLVDTLFRNSILNLDHWRHFILFLIN